MPISRILGKIIMNQNNPFFDGDSDFDEHEFDNIPIESPSRSLPPTPAVPIARPTTFFLNGSVLTFLMTLRDLLSRRGTDAPSGQSENSTQQKREDAIYDMPANNDELRVSYAVALEKLKNNAKNKKKRTKVKNKKNKKILLGVNDYTYTNQIINLYIYVFCLENMLLRRHRPYNGNQHRSSCRNKPQVQPLRVSNRVR